MNIILTERPFSRWDWIRTAAERKDYSEISDQLEEMLSAQYANRRDAWNFELFWCLCPADCPTYNTRGRRYWELWIKEKNGTRCGKALRLHDEQGEPIAISAYNVAEKWNENVHWATLSDRDRIKLLEKTEGQNESIKKQRKDKAWDDYKVESKTILTRDPSDPVRRETVHALGESTRIAVPAKIMRPDGSFVPAAEVAPVEAVPAQEPEPEPAKESGAAAPIPVPYHKNKKHQR